MFQYLPLPATQEVRDSSGVTPCIVMKTDGALYHHVGHAITMSSPKLKKHCEGPGTTQEMNLSSGQYETSTKVDALLVYDAFQTFGKR